MHDRNDDDEARLISQCRSGSREAWNELYQKYVLLVKKVVKDQLWNPSQQDVEDVTQVVFKNLWKEALDRFDGSYRLSMFIGGVAKRTTREEIRGRLTVKRNAPTNPIDLHDGDPGEVAMVPSPNPSQEEHLAHEELKDILRRGLSELSEKCFEIIRYRDFEELSFKEIGNILGEKENTLTKRHERCTEKLKANSHRLLRKECAR